MADVDRSPEGFLEPDVAVGTQFGQYAIGRLIGRGGMGAVYEALHTPLKRRVALKTIRHERALNEDAAARFRREMAAIGQLQHPQIVLAHDAGEIDGTQYLAMELVDGLDAGRLVRRSGKLSIADACEIIRQAALGLEYVHGHGLVHRDVKPSNLLVAHTGQVKISDLGLARHGDDESVESLTLSGHTLGTVDYMSPEHIRGDGPIDGRSDLYSCGCALFELLTGRPPFAGPGFKTGIAKLRAHEFTAPPRASALREEIPPELDDLVAQLLEKSPDRRPTGARELIERLSPFALGADLNKLLEQAGPAEESSVDNSLRSTPPGATLSTRVVRAPRTTEAKRRVALPAGLRKRAVRRWGAPLVVAVLVGGAGWVGYGVRPLAVVPSGPSVEREEEPAPPPVIRKPFQELAPDQIVRGRWYSLLEVEPQRVLWPEDGGLSTWQFTPEADQFTGTCLGEGLISLAHAEADDFLFELDIGQANWNGRIGVVWGLHEFRDDSLTGWESQVIRLTQSTTKPTTDNWLMRCTHRFIRRPEGDYAGGPIGDGGRADIPFPIGPTARVELRIRRGRLEEARWNGAKLEWRGARREAIVPDGHIGVYVARTDVVVRNARIMIR